MLRDAAQSARISFLLSSVGCERAVEPSRVDFEVFSYRVFIGIVQSVIFVPDLGVVCSRVRRWRSEVSVGSVVVSVLLCLAGSLRLLSVWAPRWASMIPVAVAASEVSVSGSGS